MKSTLTMYRVFLVTCSLILGGVAAIAWTPSAQAVTKTVCDTGTPDFSTLAAAVADANANFPAGGVTYDVCAGFTETAPVGGYVLTSNGTAGNPVIFEKSGAGANPLITANGALVVGSLSDGIFKIVGGDFITIDGFTLQENPANLVTAAATNNMTEWGVALLYATTTNGSQNNTIQNCTITLNRAYTNSFAIYSNTRHAPATPTATAEVTTAAGANSNNKVYANTINNVNYGIVFIGAGTTIAAIDTGNDIGGVGAGTGNILTNWGGAASASAFVSLSASSVGIFANQQINDNISFNSLTSAATATVAVQLNGIIKAFTVASPTAGTVTTTNMNSNTVTLSDSPTTAQLTALGAQGMAANAAATINVNNNLILNGTISGAGATTALFVGILNSSGPGTMNINNNTIRGTSISSSGAGVFVGIQQQTNLVQTALNINNNHIGDATAGAVNYTTALTTATLTGLSVTSTGAGPACDVSISNNDFRGITFTTSGTGAQTYLINSSPSRSQTITGNTFTNLNVNTTGSITFISDSASVPNVAGCGKFINNNSIVTAFNKGGAGGTVTLYNDGASTVCTVPVENKNNNFSNFTVTGATTVAGWFNNDGTGSTPLKTITGNTFNSWTCGTSTVTVLQSNFGGSSTITGNTITNITGQGAVTGLLNGSSGTVAALSLSNNTITGVSSTGTGGTVTGLSNANAATTVTISGNTINTLSTTGASSTVVGITSSAGVTATIASNTINTLAGSGVTSPVANGISVSGGTTVSISKNKVFDVAENGAISTTSPAVNGLLMSGGTTVTASNNIIGDLRAPNASLTDAIRGISVTSAAAATTYNVYYNTVFVNAVSSGANFGTTGLFHAASSTATTATMNLRNSIIDNRSTANGTGFTVVYRRSSGAAGTLANYGASSNNNDLYYGTAAATKLIYSDGVSTAATITAYKNGVFTAGTIAPRDSASFFDPTYLSTSGPNPNFLHIDPTVATQVESGAVNIAGITDDFDGNIRQGNAGYPGTGTAPDVGADEFNGIGQDLSPPAISYSLLGNGIVAPNRSFSNVTATDSSGVNTTAGTRPRVYYKKSSDGANTVNDNTSGTAGWKFVEASGGGGSPFSFTIDYSLLFGGGGVSVGDSIQYFVVAQDNAAIPNVGINNGTFNSTPSSVALLAANFPITGTINSYSIVATISGTQTVCASGCTYTTLTGAGGAFATINGSVVTGNLDIQIAGDLIVGEDGSNGLNALAEEPSGSNFSTRIYPTGVARVITGSFNGALVRLNGSSRVTIDGSIAGTGTDRSLTITNTSITTPSVVLIGSTGTTTITNDALKNCIIVNGVNTNSAVVISDAGTLGNAGFFNNVTIQNNDVRKAFVGVFATGGTIPQNGSNLVYTQNTLSASGANAIRNVGLYMQGVNGATVSSNTVGNFDNANDENDTGIWLATGTINAVVSGNTVTALTYPGTGAFSPVGINVTSTVAASGDVVRGNTITNFTSSGTSSTALVVGISVTGTTGGVTIERNDVQNIGNLNGATWPAVGINLNGGNNNTVKNNFVSRIYNDQSAGTGAFGPTFGVTGIRLNAGTGHLVYNNSVHLFGAMNGAISTDMVIGLAVSATTVTGCDIRNNILSNEMTGGNTGGNTRFVAIHLASGGTSAMNLTLNNNAYYEGTDPNCRMAVVGTSVGSGDFAAANFNPASTTPATNFRSYSSTLSAAGTNDNASLATTSAVPFVSSTNLHINLCQSYPVSNAGASIGSVTDDFDGDVRSATPDIGADEYTGVSCNDGNPCTVDTCHPVNGCSFPVGNAGATCRAAVTTCDAAELCTGASSVCPPDGVQPATTPCGSPADTDCDNPDHCTGVDTNCDPNPEPNTTTCGDAGTQCTNQDFCNGLGTCQDNGFAPVDTICGSQSDTDCDNPNSCNGAGICRENYENIGHACSDGLACTTGDNCNGSGTCVNTGSVSCDDSSACTSDACVEPSGTCSYTTSGSCDIVGLIHYYRDSNSNSEPSTKPIAGEVVERISSLEPTSTATTDVNGQYTFTNEGGHITLNPQDLLSTSEAGCHAAITSADATQIAMASIALVTFTPDQTVAGDVSNFGGISAYDAALVAQKAVANPCLSYIFPIRNATNSDWAWDPVSKDFPALFGTENYNFLGILYGDVTGNWVPPVLFSEGMAPREDGAIRMVRGSDQAQTIVRAENSGPAVLYLAGVPHQNQDGTWTLVLGLQNSDGILGLDLNLNHDATAIHIRSVESTDISAGLATVTNDDGHGVYSIAMFGANALQGSGAFLKVTYDMPTHVDGVPFAVAASANEGQISITWSGVPRGGPPSRITADE